MTEKQAPRDAAAVRIVPPLVPLAVVLMGVGLSKLWPIQLGIETVAMPARYLGGALIVGAIAVILWIILLFTKTGQNPDPHTPTPEIVVSGPFRISRNPIYLQMVVICLGFAIARLDPWTLLLTPLAVWLLTRWVIVPEEAYLTAKFGERYLTYKRRVRRWI